jgi:exodeoxyribonuclease V alpha subunit
MRANAPGREFLTDCDVLTIQDLLELHGAEDELLEVLLACMFAELNHGSLCLKIPSATYSAVLEDFEASNHADAIREKLSGRGCASSPRSWCDLIGKPGEFTPLVCVTAAGNGAVYLYFQRYYEYEKRVREQILARTEAPPATIPEAQARDAAAQASSLQWPLSTAQKAALALAIRQRFLIISGGPGTGKTTSVVSILRCLARLGCRPERIFLAAPTGRAAYRLTSAIRDGLMGRPAEVDRALLELEACTIHRLLQYRPSRHDFAHHAGNPLQADVVVVDEVSMVDAGLMASLLDAVPPAARLIFLGDKDQLPSVEAGAVLADLIPAAERPQYSPEALHWVRSVAQISWPQPPAAGEAPAAPRLAAKDEPLFANLLPVPTGGGGDLDHVVVLTENHRAAETNIAEVVKCLTGPPNQKAIEPKLFALDAKCRGYQFLELTPELAATESWPQLLQSWAQEHYLATIRSAAVKIGVANSRAGPTVPLADARGSATAGEQTYKELLGRAAAQFDFARPDGISRELAADILGRVRSAQILTVLRHGRFGCAGVNALLTQYLGPKLDKHPGRGYFAGLPILITRNNYDLDLFNGDAGVILRDKHGRWRALFERPQSSAGVECFALDQLPPWEPALAITVHKSQGSEYGEVLLVVPPAERSAGVSPVDELPLQRLLTAEILYTGLTRARNSVILCGTRNVLLQAALRRVERSSGLTSPYFQTTPARQTSP